MRRWTLTLDNPVVTKEFRSRMRGARAYWLLFGYLLLLSLTLFFAYLAWWNSHQVAMDYGGGGQAGFTVGRTFFLTLFYAQAIMVTLITPALTAGAISIEREQRTFEMLRSTTLPPRAITLGKLASSVSFIVLLLTSSLPLVSLCFLLGGVSPGEVFFGYLLLVCDAFVFGAIGLAWSAYAANTATATALSYGSIFLWFALTFPFAIPGMSSSGPSVGLSALNPVGAVTGSVTAEHYYGWTLASWIPALLIKGALGVLLVLSCINRLEDYPARRAWGMRAAALVFLGLLLLFGNGMIFSPVMQQGGGVPDYGQISVLTVMALAIVLLFVPVYVTGDLAEWTPGRSAGATLLSGWAPRRILGNATLPSGLPFALLLTALVAGLMFAAVHLAGGPQAVLLRGPLRGATPVSAANLTAVTPLLWQATGLLAALAVGLGGIGFLLSVLLGNRWAALTMVYLTLILGMALPYFSYGALQGHDVVSAAHNPAINTLYLCPWMGLLQLAFSLVTLHPHQRADTFEGTFPIVRDLVGYGDNTIWILSALLYLLIGAVCYGVGFVVLKAKARPQPKTASPQAVRTA